MQKKQRGKASLRGNSESWRKLIAVQSGSGLSVKAYCAREGVSESAYYRWQKLLKAESGQGFSPIELSEAPLCGLVVDLPGGASLRFSSLPPASYLGVVLASFNTGTP